MTNGTQFHTLSDRQLPIFSSAEAHPDGTGEMQKKLQQLALKQAQIRTRIRVLRHAMSTLIEAFGPAILCADHPVAGEASHPQPVPIPPMIDLCRMILRKSQQWLTLSQIHDAIRIQYPFSMSRFLKPGTALSNALWTLHRHGVVETQLHSDIREWRLLLEQAGVVSECTEIENTGARRSQ